MIKIISDEINDFLELLQNEYSNDAPFYLHICEGCDSIQNPCTEGLAFGMFNRETNHCYVAGELEEEQVLKTIAHEYKHYVQKCEEIDFKCISTSSILLNRTIFISLSKLCIAMISSKLVPSLNLPVFISSIKKRLKQFTTL